MKKIVVKKPAPNPTKKPVNSNEDSVESSALPAELKAGTRRIGVSKGLTLNMGNFNSARIAFWMERVVDDTNAAGNKAMVEMSQLIEDALEEEARELREE